jgi:di/tricarboxylate transporter
MTHQQILVFAIIAATMALFIWGRLRYDMVALLALLAGVFTGLVPHDKAFTGFSDDIVIIVGSALVVSAGLARSGVLEVAMARVAPNLNSVQAQVVVLVASVTLLSAFVKNIGALAMMIPIAMQMARRSEAAPSCYLMPMSFGALLGGLVTMIGTSPNIIVSRMRAEIVGEPFRMFDYAPVGLGLALLGIVFLSFAYRLLPSRREAGAGLDAALDISDYVTEARVTAGSAVLGQTIGDLKRLADDEVTITALVRGRTRNAAPLPDARLREGDIVMIEGEPTALERAVASGGLELEGEDRPSEPAPEGDGEIGVVEGVVGPNALLVNQTAAGLDLHAAFGVNLLAVSRAGERIVKRLRDVRLRTGDVIVLQGNLSQMPERLRDLGVLPLAHRSLRLGFGRRGIIALSVLAFSIGTTAFGALPVGIAFLTGAVLMILLGALPLREAYEAIDWPILVMLGALIPVSDAVRSTGGTDLIATGLFEVAHLLPAAGAVALVLVVAMAVTPFLNNAATVLVMAPVAASFAGQLGYRPDAFLMAVAIGAGCDFLTPVGHQCNTLVMGPGGYRFGDYARLGAPLSVLVVIVSVPLLMLVWPLN